MEKKLYRNEHNKVVAGVCSGLADYMQMDITMIRIVAVLLTVFAAGSGLIAYLIIWAMVPVNPDRTARMKHFNDYFAKQDPNMFNSANAFNNAGNTDTNKWNTTNAPFGTGPAYDPGAFKKKDSTGRVIGGLFLLVLGFYFLVRQFDILPYWFSLRKLWPLGLVIVGISFILKSKRDTEWENFSKSMKQENEPIVTPT
ncbi:MAG: PspC domain-containing protein, partial [Pedobacter sp.]